MTNLNLTVLSVQSETPDVRSLVLGSGTNEPLPPFTAGAHLKVLIPGQSGSRCYSLVCIDDDPASFSAPNHYRLGIRLEDPGTGGSRFMHALRPGDSFEAEGPRNDFPLQGVQAGGPSVLLIAGGIGITPLTSMAARLKRAGVAFDLHYYGRSRRQMGFLSRLAEQHGKALHIHASDETNSRLSLSELLDRTRPEQHIYVCGPKSLIDEVIQQSRDRGWPPSNVHFELFNNAALQAGERGFEVELKKSGKVFFVPPDKTILEVLEAGGCEPMFDCRRGECGACQAAVLEGLPDHRDYYLSQAERDAGKLIQICVSRSRSDRLVLDL